MAYHIKKGVIKFSSLIFSLGFGLFLATSAQSATSLEEQLIERIKPHGQVCVEGEDCGDIAAPVAAAPAEPRSGSEVYNATCAGCHGTGAGGAPKVGDSGAWSARLGKGFDAMVSNAINGFNGMPPRGTCGNCSDDEILATVQYIVDNSQ